MMEVDEFIAHYASEFYNPQKAHEYYLKTRKLKNKAAATSFTNDNQKKAYAIAKDSIDSAKASDLAKNADTANQAMDSAHADAQAASERISAKLTDFLKQVMSDTPVPGNASPALRSFLEAQRSARSRGAGKQANADLQKVGNDLKAAIAKAREAYATGKQTITDKYDQAALTEHENIRTKVKGPKTKTTSRKTRSKKRTATEKRKHRTSVRTHSKPRLKKRVHSQAKADAIKKHVQRTTTMRAV